MQAVVLGHPERFLTTTVMLTAALDVDFAGNIGRACTGEPNPLGLPSPRREVLGVLAERSQPIPMSRGPELAGIRTPFLVIQGGQDPQNPPPHGRHIAALIPGAGLVEIEALGHALPSSLHVQIVREMSDHMRNKSPKKGGPCGRNGAFLRSGKHRDEQPANAGCWAIVGKLEFRNNQHNRIRDGQR